MWMSGSGDAINPQAELPSCNHTCSACAMEHCEALVWEYGRLQTLLAQYPQIRQNISKILASRLLELEERFREAKRRCYREHSCPDQGEEDTCKKHSHQHSENDPYHRPDAYLKPLWRRRSLRKVLQICH
jgi:hypothetical protein